MKAKSLNAKDHTLFPASEKLAKKDTMNSMNINAIKIHEN